jgi:hypothetical protein
VLVSIDEEAEEPRLVALTLHGQSCRERIIEIEVNFTAEGNQLRYFAYEASHHNQRLIRNSMNFKIAVECPTSSIWKMVNRSNSGCDGEDQP